MEGGGAPPPGQHQRQSPANGLQGSGLGVTLGVAGDVDNDLVVPPDTRAVSTALSLHGVDSSEAMYIRDISHLGR